MQHQVEIDRLTIHTQSSQRTTARQHVERILTATDFYPRGLGSGAILLIRRLDNLPPLDLSQPLDFDWETQVRQRIQDLYRQAIRPGPNGTIPHDANSILFLDAAEMLACMTRVVISNSVTSHQWYWPHLISQILENPSALVTQLWQDHAMALPAGLAMLNTHVIMRVLNTMTPSQISQIVTALHTVFVLPDTILQATVSDDRLPQQKPPWSPLPTTVIKHLTPQQHYLLGLCKILIDKPAYARTTTFMDQATQWLQSALIANTVPISETELSSNLVAHDSDILTTDFWLAEEGLVVSDDTRSIADGLLDTQLGGIFYLINVLAWLDLSDEDLAPYASAWRVIDGLARFLLGDEIVHFADDVVWQVLAQLDDPNVDTSVESNVKTPIWPVWLEQAAQTIEAMLAQHLHHPAGIAQQLLIKPAQLQISHTHIDVFFPMDCSDVEIRRAGLDVDPRWQPSLRYIITFHFIEV